MGSGKTTLGQLIATSLGYEFVDSDKDIEATTGVSIPTIFDYEGEDGFREREIHSIDLLTQKNKVVVATGGGAVLREENRQALRERGFVIYLKVSVHVQLMRTARDKNRPLLQTPDRKKTLQKMATIRAPLYEQTAHFSIRTDNVRTRTLKSRIIKAYKAHIASNTSPST